MMGKEMWCRHCCAECEQGRQAFWTIVCPSCLTYLTYAWTQPFFTITSSYGPSGVRRISKGVDLHRKGIQMTK